MRKNYEIMLVYNKEKVPLRPLEDVRNRNEGVQEANYDTSEDRYPRPRPEDNCFVLLSAKKMMHQVAY